MLRSIAASTDNDISTSSTALRCVSKHEGQPSSFETRAYKVQRMKVRLRPRAPQDEGESGITLRARA